MTTGLLALVCAGAVAAADPMISPANADRSDKAVSAALAVQSALQQGRDYLLHAEYKAAVCTLEGQLPFINGNKVYLKALEDAYRGYIKELRLAKQDIDAQRYLERLLYLDKGALLDKTLTSGAAPATTAPYPLNRATIYRAKNLDEQAQASRLQERAGSQEILTLLARAEQEFSAKHFSEARLIYDKIARADQKLLDADAAQRERWAYCKLHSVVEQINQSDRQKPAWSDLEKEVRVALTLAPRLEGYGKDLLTKIQDFRVETPASPKAETALAVRHAERNDQGWLIAETTNFRIFHKQTNEAAEQAADIAERTRSQVLQKWFGAGQSSSLKCDIYVHPTGEEYSRDTGTYNSPGHSTIKVESGRLIVSRIDIHADEPTMLAAVLPHETTHVVLAGAFGGQLVPRWVDEGMAVLSEPRQRVQRYLDMLGKFRQSNEMFHVQDLMQLDNYPKDSRYVGTFYSQSVSLVEFLAAQKGPQEFTLFVLDSFRYGHEKALQRHYGFRNFAELEDRWYQGVFHEQAAATNGR